MARLRQRKDRGYWLLDYIDPYDEKRYQINVGPSEEVAQVWLAKCQEKIALVKLGQLQSVGNITQADVQKKKIDKKKRIRLSQFKDLYDEQGTREYHFSDKTQEISKNAFNSLIGHIGDRQLLNVEPDHIRKWIMKLRKSNKSLTTESMYGRSLRAAFNRAIKWGYLEQNPFAGVELPSNRRTRRKEKNMSIADVKTLLKTIDKTGPKQFADYVRCLLYTGARRNEILFLKGEDVDLKENVLAITVTKRKGGPVRLELPINSSLRKVLKGMVIKEGHYLFKTDSNSRGAKKKGKAWHPSYVTRYFKQMIIKAKLPERYSIHSLRHTYVTYLHTKGVPIDIIQRLVGHTSPMMTWDTYDHTEALSYRKYADLVQFEEE